MVKIPNIMEINIYEDINANTLDKVRTALQSEDNELNIHLDSAGGSLPVGLQIYDLLRTAKNKVLKTYNDGIVMSSATLIYLAAKAENRYSQRHSTFLIHQPLTSLGGYANLRELTDTVEVMQRANDELVNIYKDRLFISEDEIRNLMAQEKEIFASEAQGYGFFNNYIELQNNAKITDSIMKNKNKLVEFLNAAVRFLKNEKYVTSDGKEFETIAIEIGQAVSGIEDGVYEVEGKTITIENGVIIDVITETAETETIENEGETTETETAETIEETTEEVEQILQTAESELVEVQTPEDLQEIAEEVQTLIEQAVSEVVEKYKGLTNAYRTQKQLINKCGGVERLKSLANVKNETKACVSEQPKQTKRSLKELMDLK